MKPMAHLRCLLTPLIVVRLATFVTDKNSCISLDLNSNVTLKFGIHSDNVTLAEDKHMENVVMVKTQITLIVAKEKLGSLDRVVSSFVNNTFELSINLRSTKHILLQHATRENVWSIGIDKRNAVI